MIQIFTEDPQNEYYYYEGDNYKDKDYNYGSYASECEVSLHKLKAEIIELKKGQEECRINPCQNGQYIDLGNDYRCDCHSGYAGKDCDMPCPVHKKSYRIVDGTCFR